MSQTLAEKVGRQVPLVLVAEERELGSNTLCPSTHFVTGAAGSVFTGIALVAVFGASSKTAEQLQMALETSEIAAAAITARLLLPDLAEKAGEALSEPRTLSRGWRWNLSRGPMSVPTCGRLHRLGEDVPEELEYVPGRLGSCP